MKHEAYFTVREFFEQKCLLKSAITQSKSSQSLIRHFFFEAKKKDVKKKAEKSRHLAPKFQDL